MDALRLSQLGLTQKNVTAVLFLFAAALLLLLILWVVLAVLQAVGIARQCEKQQPACGWLAFVPVLRGVAWGRAAGQKKLAVAFTVVKGVAAAAVVALLFCTLAEGTRLLFAADAAVADAAALSFSVSVWWKAAAVAAALAFAFDWILRLCCAGCIFARSEIPVAGRILLSILFPFLLPIFLYAVRNRNGDAAARVL